MCLQVVKREGEYGSTVFVCLHSIRVSLPSNVLFYLQVVNGACGYGFSVFVCKSKEVNKYELYGSGINTDNQLGYHEYPHKSGW